MLSVDDVERSRKYGLRFTDHGLRKLAVGTQYDQKVCSYSDRMEHELIDQRSIALHRLVAEKVSADPSLISRALRWIRQRLESVDRGAASRRALQEWADLMSSSSPERLCELLVQDSERMRRLRQSSPFAGFLSPAERSAVMRKYAKRAA
jgi:hypothetical protein